MSVSPMIAGLAGAGEQQGTNTLWDYLAPITATVLAAIGIILALSAVEGKTKWIWIFAITAVFAINVPASILSVRSMHTAQDALLQSITGGDSYAMILPTFWSRDKLRMLLMNKGKFPLYDLQVSIMDQDKYVEMVSKSANIEKDISEIEARTRAVFWIGNLGTDQGRYFPEIDLDSTKGQRNFLVYLLARDGQVNEELKLRWIREKDSWSVAFKVYSQKGILEEQIGKNYPSDQLWK
jgi:hypothetical protein